MAGYTRKRPLPLTKSQPRKLSRKKVVTPVIHATQTTVSTATSSTSSPGYRSARHRTPRRRSNLITQYQRKPATAGAQAAGYRSRSSISLKRKPAPQPNFFDRYRLAITSVTAVAMSVCIIGFSWFMYSLVFQDLPAIDDLTKLPLAVSSKIYDRNGELLYTMFDDENRTLVPLAKISPSLMQATIAIEDKDFYQHPGFSVTGIARALYENFQGESVQGGSTITQQLVKNRLLTKEKTYRRKVRELLLSILAEHTYTKDQILEMYLNTANYGGSTYGIEAASQRYFGKPASDLDLAESALLAGLPQRPTAYSPFGPTPDLAKMRQQEVLRRMQEDAYISAEQAQAAMSEELALVNSETEIRAPHFVMYVRQLLADKYGEEALLTDGLQVKTTLDLSTQEQTQQTVTNEVTQLKRLRISNGAALVTNPQTGEILAMVGSVDYFDIANDGQVNVVLRPRQPGSSIKPLTYAMALANGATMNTLISDAPISYNFPGSPPYTPKNYDGKFHGMVTLKEALANSYNIPAVKMLASVGINNFIDKAEEMGITTWGDRSRFGLSLTLGGGEVRMLDLATAYGVFPNKGNRVDPNPIIEITNARGEVLYRNECVLEGKCQKEQVYNERVAYLITNILSDNKARTPAFGALSTLTIPGQEVAVKTGTTNSMRDNWTVGYTTDRLVAVWVGNNDNTPMSYVASGITGASPIWNEIIRTQLPTQGSHTFSIPAGLVKTAACRGTSSGDFYIAGTEPRGGCPRPRPTATDPNASPPPGGPSAQQRQNTAL